MSNTFPAVPLDTARQKIIDLGQDLPDKFEENRTEYVCQDFSRKPFRRRLFSQCLFQTCDFSRAVGTGSRWPNSEFLGCTFDGADMEFADFTGATFASNSEGKPTTIHGSGFNATIMRQTRFENFSVQGSSFAQSDFTNAELINCDIMDGTYEGCLFQNAKLENVSFANANVEFIDFKGASFHNTLLPLMQVPYAFGLSVKQLEQENVQISAGELGKALSYQEFYENLPALTSYFVATREFFALANLALMYGDNDSFKNYLQEGMLSATNLGNFRELKYLCKLAASDTVEKETLSRGVLKKFYDTLINNISNIGDPGIIQQYSLHDGLIRSYLLNHQDNELTIGFTTTTDDAIQAQQSVAQVAAAIQKVSRFVGLGVEFQHIDVATYSNAQAQLKTLETTVELPLGIKITRKSEYETTPPPQGSSKKSPWNSQTTFMAIIVTTSMLFAGANFAKGMFDSYDGGAEFEQGLQEKQSEIMQIHETIKELVEPDTLKFIQGVMQIADVHEGQLRLHNKNPASPMLSLT